MNCNANFTNDIAEEIQCVYGNGFAITKRSIREAKKFGKIVKNYLKIKRIIKSFEQQSLNNTNNEILNYTRTN